MNNAVLRATFEKQRSSERLTRSGEAQLLVFFIINVVRT
jgi:hypothetical protein